MEELDIPALAERIAEHRFRAHSDNMIADEIDRFRAGPGTAGIGDAVDALLALAEALVQTDETLRTELGKLGVEWQSEAATQAGSVITSHAVFSAEAHERLADTAQRVFAQGEAFDRTLHKLPDSQTLRDGAGGYSLKDSLFSFVGYETDNAKKVERGREAREQALRVLADYAQDSGENLMGLPTLEAPPQLRAETGLPAAGAVEIDGGIDDTTSAAGGGGSTSGGGVAAPSVSGPADGARGGSLTTAAASPSTPGGPISAPSPISGPERGGFSPSATPRQPAGSSAVAAASTAHSDTATRGAQSSARPRPVPSTSISPAGSASPAPRGTASDSPGAPAGRGASTPAPPGRVSGGTAGSPGMSDGGATGSQSPGSGRQPGGQLPGGQAPGGQAPGGQAPGGQAPGGSAHSLSKGLSSGAAPVKSELPPSGRSGAAPTGAGPRGSLSMADHGGAAAAVGAGGAAGALSGAGERQGRGVGRNAPGAARSPRPLAVGDLAEEEARVVRNSERLAHPSPPHDDLLTPAATREEDDEAVRRFGVDDSDLFADQRRVAPDVIGDDVG